MHEDLTIRPGAPTDALDCAAMLNDWIDASDWLPRVRSREVIEADYCERVFKIREIYVIGRPACAFISLTEEGEVASLFNATPGTRHGKTLLDHAKGLKSRLELWSFEANHGACRFYEREGFVKERREEGANDEDLPDILYRWAAV